MHTISTNSFDEQLVCRMRAWRPPLVIHSPIHVLIFSLHSHTFVYISSHTTSDSLTNFKNNCWSVLEIYHILYTLYLLKISFKSKKVKTGKKKISFLFIKNVWPKASFYKMRAFCLSVHALLFVVVMESESAYFHTSFFSTPTNASFLQTSANNLIWGQSTIQYLC